MEKNLDSMAFSSRKSAEFFWNCVKVHIKLVEVWCRRDHAWQILPDL